MNITSIRGFNDILPAQSKMWDHIENEASAVFSSYGFGHARLPVLEKTELFLRSIGDTTDIVEKQMYTFPDRKGESLTLRPEGTAPAVRAFIENKLYNDSPVTRFFYTGPMFRYERPQKGRYRQFYQIGAEVFGEAAPGVDAETIEMLHRLLLRLGVEDVNFEINSLGCDMPECRAKYKTELTCFLKAKRSELCDNCQRRIDENPLRALDCKTPKCIELTNDAPPLEASICPDCCEHFNAVKTALKNACVPALVNPRMVRGLDYYSKTTFEVTAGPGGPLGAQNAVAAGGRYDKLVKELGGPDTPCFGFALGMERLSLLVDEKLLPAPPLTVFIPMGDRARAKSAQITSRLREITINGDNARIIAEHKNASLKTSMKRAHRLGAKYVIILGDNELDGGVVTFKDMESGSQQEVEESSLPAFLKERLL